MDEPRVGDLAPPIRRTPFGGSFASQRGHRGVARASGLFDQAPTLKLIVSHVGGVLPYLTGRIEAALAHPFDHYLTNLYVDSVCYHIQALECCYGVMGALYGTDHPFGSHRIAAELVERLACS
ncbi:MAG: hypothetical protein ACRDRB_23690, partial [Pseudonocardiaceae bacterium]